MILHLQRHFTAVTETFIANQINALAHMNPVVFTIKNKKNLKVNAQIHTPDSNSLFSSKFLSKASATLFKEILKTDSPAVIHSHYLTDAGYFHPFTRGYKIPKICSCYGYDVSAFPRKYGWFARKYFKRVFKEYDLFLAMSNDMKNDLISLGCDPNKISIHYHGINTKDFDIDRTYRRNDTFNLLTIASLSARKGHLLVLDAIRTVKEIEPSINLTYTIVGNGDLKSELQKFVSKNALENIVSFQPETPHGTEFNSFLLNADVFVHPSTTTKTGDKEGIPGTIAEAMTSGLPVISSYHAGIPNIIENNKTGFLIKENDTVDLANKILLLYYNPELRARIGRKAKEYARLNLDMFLKAKDLEKIYKSCLQRN